MSSYGVGTLFKRRVPQNDASDEIRVVGAGVSPVVTSNVEFGQTYQLDLKVLRAEYTTLTGEDIPEPEPLPAHLLSPEEVFAAQAARDEASGVKPVETAASNRRRRAQEAK